MCVFSLSNHNKHTRTQAWPPPADVALPAYFSTRLMSRSTSMNYTWKGVCVLEHSCVFVVFTPVCLGLMTAVSKWLPQAHCLTDKRLVVMRADWAPAGKTASVMKAEVLLNCKYDAAGLLQALASLSYDFDSVDLTSNFIQSGLKVLCSWPIPCHAFSLCAVFMSRHWPFHVWTTERNIALQK